MAQIESIGYQISGINNQITDDFGADNDLEVKGGGRGWTATTTRYGTVWSAKGTSKLDAANALYDSMKAGIEDPTSDLTAEPKPETETARPTVDDAFTLLLSIFPNVERFVADDDTTPGPIWANGDDGFPVLRAVTPCVGECMAGQSDICDCRCAGANHGIGSIGFGTAWTEANTVAQRQAAIRAIRPVVMGTKECLCGCGETTQRRFVPGHDARYHAAIKREQQAAERGVAVSELPAILKAERSAAAKAKRAAAKA